jgi:hypothetical protein
MQQPFQRVTTNFNGILYQMVLVHMKVPEYFPTGKAGSFFNPDHLFQPNFPAALVSTSSSNRPFRPFLLTVSVLQVVQYKRLDAKARPEPDFRYRSNSNALCLSGKEHCQISFTGRCGFVEGT